jgi:glycosyltransferase involved in cell wall biosynthesis
VDVQLLDEADLRRSVARGDVALRVLEAHAASRLAAGELHSAAAWTQVAAQLAWRNHPGRFAFPVLERVLADLAATLPPMPRSRPAGGPVRHVLHVLTEAYDTGGHTRLAWNWMRRDTARAHHVVLTQPGAVPPALAEAAADVRALHGDVLDRALALRAAAATADVVVLHVHMHDVVVPIALGAREDGPDRPVPVVFVDHADHLAWVGTSVADVVTACREPARRVQVERRGIAPERSVLLPVPVDPAPRGQDRAAARAALGLGDGPVLLAVAAAHKFARVTDPSFFDAADAALDAVPAGQLVAVGPSPDSDGWPALAARHRGRVQALGRRSDLGALRDAADVLLDSFPFSSNTSAIEAAVHGLPVVSFAPDPEGQGVLLTHDPGFEDLVVRAADPAAYGAAVAATVADPGDLPQRLRDAALAAHAAEGWQAHLEAVYATALAAGPAPLVTHEDTAPVELWELLHHGLFRADGTAGPVAAAVVGGLRDLPAHERPTDDDELAEVLAWVGLDALEVAA